jgi:ankyrin repeat protein
MASGPRGKVADMAKKSRPPEQHAWVRWIDEGDVGQLRRWLARGGDIEDTDPKYRNTPLMYAAWHGPIEVVHLLLAYGADARRTGAFLVAVSTNHLDIARLLLPLTDDLDFLKQAADELADHVDDELLEELVTIKLKRLRAKGRRKRR